MEKKSFYKASLGAILSKQGSEIWVPGESTSMISQVVDLIDDVVVHIHPAMNGSHRKHIELEFQNGRVKILENDGTIKVNNSPEKTKFKPALDEMVEIISEKMR